MKKYLITFFFLGFMNHINAEGFKHSVKLIYDTGFGSVKNSTMGAEYICDHEFGNNWLFGLGVGSLTSDLLTYSTFPSDKSKVKQERESAWILPLYVDAKYKMAEYEGINPYILANVGYSFLNLDSNYADETKLGVFVRIGAGFSIPLKKGDLYFEASYKEQQQNIVCTGIYLDDYKNLGFAIGYTF